uniref:Uncharacterized protein TCIL3000_5_2090 n=1 Tax=Trypanosoma congolense (strain IL3000) TaxID=1068625 RepID=G0UMU4_TRYCI|nr:unnamed protein product [Trypanosoma congolense IL3000]
MNVRTNREGVDNSFCGIEISDEITSSFVGGANGTALPAVSDMASGLTPAGWTVQPNSRSAILFQESNVFSELQAVNQTNDSTSLAAESSGVEENSGRAEGEILVHEVCCAFMGADDELDRHDALQQLSRELEENFIIHGRLGVSSSSTSGRYQGESKQWSLLTPQELRELTSRWIMQSINEMTVVGSHRTGVTLLDRGATVRLKSPEGGGSTSAGVSNVECSAVMTPSEGLYCVHQLADMANGQYWVEVEAPSAKSEEKMATESRTRYDRDELLLSPPKPIYFDPLLPVDEVNNVRGTSTCLFLAASLAFRRLHSRNGADATGPMPWEALIRKMVVQMGLCAQEARKKVYELCHKRRKSFSVVGDTPDSTQLAKKVEVRLAGDYVTLAYRGKTIEILQRTARLLSLLWDARVAMENSSTESTSSRKLWQNAVDRQLASTDDVKTHFFTTTEPFFVRMFTLLLRYTSLFGDLGYNHGPHAALPPVIMQQLRDMFHIQCEAFASPLNVQLPLFGSLFPDTDQYFGSMGAFFDLSLTSGHYEVNPPFVTSVLRRLETFLLKDTLPANDGDDAAPMLFVVVLPSHDLDEAESDAGPVQGILDATRGTHETNCQLSRRRDRLGNKKAQYGGRTVEDSNGFQENTKDSNCTSTDRALRESSYCLAHVLCAANESVYVDGHQHVIRAPLFCIGSPTRLIVLGNRAARLRYADAKCRLDSVRQAWRCYTVESRSKNPLPSSSSA